MNLSKPHSVGPSAGQTAPGTGDVAAHRFAGIDAVVFDIDGTLIDSVDAHGDAWQKALAAHGLTPSYEAIRAEIGKGPDQLLPALIPPPLLQALARKVSAEHDRVFAVEHKPFVRPFPQVRELFAALRGAGKTLVLATSGKRGDAQYFADLARIDRLLDGIASADDIGRTKPEPDLFAVALKKAGTPRPDQTVMVGDTPWDAIGAVRCGMRAIGLRCGGVSDDVLRRAGCEAVFADPAALLEQAA
jgi:HAD superfamily hydrolase (TIGR01509 family)